MTMVVSESTCWTVIRGAAAGSSSDRNEMARRYLGVVRAYLSARWRGSWLRQEIDDATQEVFVECFRRGGAVEAAGAGRVPDFRAFLYGVIRNVARRFESRPVRASSRPPEVLADEGCQLRLFERTWAQAIMTEAAGLQRQRAAEVGPAALQRVELLRLRFEENMPIRIIAELWRVDAAKLHHAYTLARQEFRTALLEVVAFHHPGSPAEVEQEAAGLLRSFS
jgi:RNA polymerase sigma-70 factor (ECF subfamily)